MHIVTLETAGTAVVRGEAPDAPPAGVARWPGRPFGRPAVPAAVALAAGVAVGQVWGIGPGRMVFEGSVALGVALIVGVLGWFGGYSKVVGIFCDLIILAALALGGVAAARLARDFYAPSHVANFASNDARLAEMKLTVVSEPTIEGNDPLGQAMPPIESLLARVQEVRAWSGWQNASGLVQVDLRQPVARLAIGQRVRVLGWLARMGPAMNPGQADRAAADRRQRILVSLYVTRAEQVRILDEGRDSMLAWLRRRTRLLLSEGFDASSKSQAATLGMILLGDNETESRPLRDDLTRNGVTHLIATSGLHVLILALVLAAGLRLLLVRPALAAFCVIGLSVFYAAVVTPSPGAQRAVIAAGVVAVAGIAGRRVDALQVLALAVIALLLCQPSEIAGPALQLGVVIVAGLIVYARYRPPMDEGEMLEERARVIARQIGRVRAEARWRTIGRSILRPIAETARMAVLAWLLALPLVALHFGALNPWSILVGLLLLPLAALAVVAAAAKIGLTLVLPSLAPIWAQGAGWTSDVLRRAAHLTAELSGAQIAVAQPSVWFVLLALVLMLLPVVAALLPGQAFAGRMTKWMTPRLRRRAAWLGPTIAVAMIGGSAWAGSGPANGLTLTVLAVGGGQDLVVQSGAALPAVIDAGSSGNANIVHTVIGPFLWHEQVSRIGTLVLTDAGYGRLGAPAELVTLEKPRALWVGPSFERVASSDPLGREMMAEFESSGVSPHVLGMGDSLPIGDAKASVIWPRSAGGRRGGQNAIVLRITYAGRSILIAGDVTDREIAQMLRHTESLKSDVLIAPSAGSWSKAMGTFVAAVEPAYILASSANNLTPRQWEFDVRVHQAVWRTGQLGAITVKIAADGSMNVSPWRKWPTEGEQVSLAK
jgi:competence protein ComEC